eukprot:TRINITY_DN13905_c0_g1_i1.p1 TRINITY_DN13905_c0_g1~~TRINITY_DN13905_c0_g1_i1.p1  ORF type:complete len:300 (-),score=43.84 TRINITY_DN13905_c0_g1_i1:506-1405(-)
MSAAYGAAPMKVIAGQLHGKSRLNIGGICLSFFVPWLLFCAVYATRTFSIRLTSISMGVIFIALLLILVFFALAFQAVQRKRRGEANYEPMWYIFLFLTTLLAFILSMLIGEWNWSNHMAGYFGMAHLNDYSRVDPARMRGKQIMDAGAVNFVEGAFVDTKLAMAFRSDGLYCVAPITSTSLSLVAYDFWAVGKNCCSGVSGDFHCGDVKNPKAHAGMRLMQDKQRSFFRLAVQQAQSAYQIRAEHPLFFHWMEDPSASISDEKMNGWKFYIMGTFGHFFLQLILIVIAVALIGKVGAF